jgi:hypothetical protein
MHNVGIRPALGPNPDTDLDPLLIKTRMLEYQSSNKQIFIVHNTVDCDDNSFFKAK